MSPEQAQTIFEDTRQRFAGAADDTRLLQYLVDIQHRYHFIPPPAIEALQQILHLTRAQIESVIDFYSFLHSDQAIRYRILFSNNITDRWAGSAAMMQRLTVALHGCEDAGIALTACSGLCDQGPSMLINGRAIGRLTPSRIDDIAALILSGVELEDWPESLFMIDNVIQRSDRQLALSCQPAAALRRAIELGPDLILQTLNESGLRGRGGAGFATATKWSLCRQASADQRFIVCNADEGEPGTFKDRLLLAQYADSVIEGMTIAALTVSARRGFIYLRGEYRFLLEPLQADLQRRREQGLLGSAILGQAGFDFDIEIHLGAGAYICGEESALIESLEGKRGIPRIRPPFPVTHGYLGQPTIVNNVETLFSVERILQKGAKWFSEIGTEQSRSSRLISISGDCEEPGVYEYPFGVSLRQIVQDCGGSDAQAVQMAGAAGTTVLARDFDRCLSFEDLATGGSFMVIGKQRSLLDMLQNFAWFFRHESCGFCTPCRIGNHLLPELLQRFAEAQATGHDLRQLKDIAETMHRSSFCGLGSSAPTALSDALEQSPEIFTAGMASSSDNPAFDLSAATREYRTITETESW